MKTQKNDEADAEAICEAVTRPNMRFADIKTIDQHSVLVLHRTRTMLIKNRKRLGKTIRGHLADSDLAGYPVVDYNPSFDHATVSRLLMAAHGRSVKLAETGTFLEPFTRLRRG